MALEDLLRTINNDEERGQIQALLEKNPVVKTALTRGDLVAGVFDQVAALGLKPEEEVVHLPGWLDYRNKHWDPNEQKWDFTKLTEAVQAERNQLADKVAQLERERGTEMSGDEVKALAEEMFNNRLKALMEDKDNPVITGKILQGALNNQAKRFQEVWGSLESRSLSHQQKYNEPMPVQEVIDYIEKTGERDVTKAYEAVCAPRNTRLEIEQLKADGAKKFEEGRQAGVKEAVDRVNGQRFPVDGGGSQRSGSHFMSRILKRREEHAATTTRLGSGAAATAGYADYQKKQMGGSV